eukprot:765228-Hanusia_phi.AAC.5
MAGECWACAGAGRRGQGRRRGLEQVEEDKEEETERRQGHAESMQCDGAMLKVWIRAPRSQACGCRNEGTAAWACGHEDKELGGR